MEKTSRKKIAIVVGGIVLALAFTAPLVGQTKGGPEQTVHQHPDTSMQNGRQQVVAERGRHVMPFDLEETTHIFKDLPDGGLQTVVAKKPTNKKQIDLIRTHLKEEAAKFSRGDFSDPEAIHGPDMPGLAEVKAGASRIQIRYAPLPDGAQIKYTTQDPQLITAIHRWFRAQVSDHGHHAATDH